MKHKSSKTAMLPPTLLEKTFNFIKMTVGPVSVHPFVCHSQAMPLPHITFIFGMHGQSDYKATLWYDLWPVSRSTFFSWDSTISMNKFSTNVKYHSDPRPVTVTSQPIRLFTKFMKLIPSLTFPKLRVVSMEYLQPVWHASRERLLLGTTGLVPFLDLLIFRLLRPAFPTCRVFSHPFTLNTSRYSLDFAKNVFINTNKSFNNLTYPVWSKHPVSSCR